MQHTWTINEKEKVEMGNSRHARPEGNMQQPLFGAYEDKYTETLKLLLEDCQEEMLHLFHVECGNCKLQVTCCRQWLIMVCNLRNSMSAEECVNCINRFLKIKKEARIHFRYKRALCLTIRN